MSQGPASLTSGLFGLAGSRRQVAASNRATEQQRQMFDEIRQSLQPYMDTGAKALPGIENLLGFGPEGFAGISKQLESLPGYQFVKDQGLRATENMFGPRGLSVGGAAMRGAADYVTGLADTTYGEQLNRLMGAAGLGAGAATGVGGFGTTASQTIGQNLLFGGNAAAAGLSGFGNSVATGATNTSNNAMTALSMMGMFA